MSSVSPFELYPWAFKHCLAGGCDVEQGTPHPDGCRCSRCEPHLRLARGHAPQIRARNEQVQAIREPWQRIGPAGVAQMREWLRANAGILTGAGEVDSR